MSLSEAVSQTGEIPAEMQELLKLLGDLFMKSSELGLSCIEIGEEILKSQPDLKDLKEACLEVTRIIRKIVKLSKKLQKKS